MKATRLYLALAVLLAAVGLWFARSAWHTHAFSNSSLDIGANTPLDPRLDPNIEAASTGSSRARPPSGPANHPKPEHMLHPPDASRVFMDFTPEQRVQFARKGHGPGG